MGKRRIKSRPGLFGMVYYYDENGNPIGKSRPGLIDGTRVYMDQNGRYAGKSRPGFLAKEVWRIADGVSFSVRCYDVQISRNTEEDELEILIVGTLQ